MRNAQRITKIHLPVNEQDIPIVIGIVSADPDYRLSLKLNKKLSISLRNTDPVEFQDDEGNKFLSSRFTDSSGAPDLHFQLVSNRSEKNFMLKKLKNIDYLMLLHNHAKDFSPEKIMSQLREIDSITGVFKIEIKTLNDKNLKYLI
ncbi:MAG: IPExxxVDY family protein [Bacteroidia bacterium]|nr:IPExxxVDY family protein [Bacteroidia bacterium]